MDNATIGPNPGQTIRADEAAHFGQLAAEWWDPKGSSKMLHRLNPVRLGFVRDAIDAHWGGGASALRPLAGKRALDVGCGAGLLCEPLARLGAAVTGVDAAPENIVAAREHAAAMGFRTNPPKPGCAEPVEAPPLLLAERETHEEKNGASTSSAKPVLGGTITYFTGELSALNLGPFDLVTCMEVLEHVADKPAFIAGLAASLAPGGLLIVSTPNRTVQSRVLLVGAAELVGAIPRGTHHWDDFATPIELHDLLAGAGLAMGNPCGIAWSPGKGLHLSDDTALNYIVTATRPAAG